MTLAANHLDIAISLGNRASVHYAQGRLAEVRLFYEPAFAVNEVGLVQNHEDAVRLLHNLDW